jgi:hypothetical protein
LLDKRAINNSINIELGGEVLSFVPASRTVRLAMEERYRPFISNAAPGMTFRVHDEPGPHFDLGSPLFTTPLWALHHVQEQVIISMCVARTEARDLVALDPDTGQGDIYRVDVPWRRAYPEFNLECLLEGAFFVALLARGRGVLLHAAGVGDRGRGLLFSGVSGAGKSTTMRLWKSDSDAVLLSDDRIVVRRREGRFWVYGTPWYGDAQSVSPAAFPLERIFVIRHALANSVTRLRPAEAAKNLLVRSFLPFWDAPGMAFTLAFLDELVQTVPCYDFGFVPDPSAVDFVRCMS